MFSIPEHWRGDDIHNKLDKTKSHITSQNIGDSFYHIFTTPYLFLFTLFFGRLGVGINTLFEIKKIIT
jgi:hypothetical protein